MKLRNNKYLRILLLLITIIVFVVYFVHNLSSFRRIQNLSIAELAIIVVGQLTILLSNCLSVVLIGYIVGKKIPNLIAVRVTAYSALINFFGFLQGGVGFRGIYLKKYFDISYKKYFLLTAFQYMALFGLAAMCILFGLSLTRNIYYSIVIFGVCLVALLVLCLVLAKSGRLRSYIADMKVGHYLNIKTLLLFIGVAAMQLVGSAIVVATCLHVIGANVTFGGLLIYIGMTQFSIIVALTPGAIGIKEGLLLVVQKQMLLTTSDVVVASTIDRIVYFITLAIISPLAIGVNRRNIGKNPSENYSNNSAS